MPVPLPVCLSMVLCEDIEVAPGRMALVNPMSAVARAEGEWPIRLGKLGLFALLAGVGERILSWRLLRSKVPRISESTVATTGLTPLDLGANPATPTLVAAVFEDLRFAQPGVYEVVLEIDNAEIARMPLEVLP